jgi:hypothetical protein
LQSTALREELHTELERMLNDVIKFKIHVQGSLEAYEEFVAQEVEREWEEQEAQIPQLQQNNGFSDSRRRSVYGGDQMEE